VAVPGPGAPGRSTSDVHRARRGRRRAPAPRCVRWPRLVRSPRVARPAFGGGVPQALDVLTMGVRFTQNRPEQHRRPRQSGSAQGG
jgi:hypothetical protein